MSAVAPKRELEVVPVACRWYGMSNATGHLVPTGDNQCGLITAGRSDCQMERNQNPIDETRCPIVAAVARAVEHAKRNAQEAKL